MPAIRKIRIVNFRFNNGAKLIPDEIFCTENAEGKPIDTLFNLDNGGGKSVIVQLLLQPICPKAKVQNRNISDYFQKGTDHAFVLIEWALDHITVCSQGSHWLQAPQQMTKMRARPFVIILSYMITQEQATSSILSVSLFHSAQAVISARSLLTSFANICKTEGSNTILPIHCAVIRSV